MGTVQQEDRAGHEVRGLVTAARRLLHSKGDPWSQQLPGMADVLEGFQGGLHHAVLDRRNGTVSVSTMYRTSCITVARSLAPGSAC